MKYKCRRVLASDSKQEEMMIDVEELKSVLEGYKEYFPEHWKNERYKWEAVAHFQKHWDIDAPDFGEMFKEATAKAGNLLTSRNVFPQGIIECFAKADSEATRQMFKKLFDEAQDVGERVKKFIDESEFLREKYNDGTWRNHYQSTNVISIYLWLMYPDCYYIYKYGIYKDVAEVLGANYQFKKGSNDNLLNGYHMYDELCDAIRADSNVVHLLQSSLDDSCYPDPELKTLTIDVGFYISNFYKQDEVQPTQETNPTSLAQDVSETTGYWWLCANPKYWSFSDIAIGEEQSYTLCNENGHKRRIYQNFLDVKPGDKVIGYNASPMKKIVALCEITQASDGERIRLRKLENFSSTISYADVKECPELAQMEFLTHGNGSLFKLTKEEYDFLMDMIREENPIRPAEVIAPYGKADFLEDVFMTEEKYDALRDRLLYKKNVILQGAPGVGKTFAAKRLAFSVMGEKDESRVEFVQFHQNYSYEDFIMGYRPDGTGFKLTEGIFYRFCQKAENRPDKDYFFIIDEINRGNMSKIFGELLMLIENEYRGTKATLAYSGLPFAVPKNLYIIGMMNTADRSLAMIDYALRRRFSFFEMEPGFDSAGFKKLQSRMSDETFDALIEQIQALNADIAKDASLGKGFQIGHSYFCLKKDETCSAQWLRSIVDFDILPTLSEYWYDEPDKVSDWEKKLRGVFHDGR